MHESIQRTFHYADGSENKLSFFRTVAQSDQLILILPALGIRASYYEKLALAFAQQGIHAATVDWRGHGYSSLRPSYEVDFGYAQLLRDIRQALEEVEQMQPQSKKYLLGHSLGGQLAALLASRHPEEVAGLFLVGACCVHPRLFGRDAWKIRWASRLFPWVARFFGHYPGQYFGFGGREARGVMADWASHARSGLYRPAEDDFDYEAALPNTKLPVRAFYIPEDDLAPLEAVEALMNKLAANIDTELVRLPETLPDGTEIDHFNWARQPKAVVAEVLETLRNKWAANDA